MALSKRRLDLVANSGIDSETWGDLPVVLHIPTDVLLLGCKLGVDAGGSSVVGDAQEE